MQYYRYGFWHKECPLNMEQMKNYLPDFCAYYLLFPLSFRDRNALCEDKRLMYSLNAGLGIPQPHELFNTRDGAFFDSRLDSLALAKSATASTTARPAAYSSSRPSAWAARASGSSNAQMQGMPTARRTNP